MEPATILIVDDEKAARFAMRRTLDKEGHRLAEASGADEAIGAIKAGSVDLVFLDLQMPGKDGLTALAEIMELPSPPLVVMVTAFGSERTAVEAIKRGAYDYVAKPYDVDELRLLVRRAHERISLRQENLRLKEELARARAAHDILGQSPSMRRVLDRIDRVASTEVTVLITGESGTGKELVAKAIHRQSSRYREPFVVFDCSNVDPSLIRSELFGHEKGAYTGADCERAGSFERASGGTLFIDEVAELDLDLQPRLLRVLESREVCRLGSDRPRKVDVRLVAATNKDLSKMVKEGAFRDDLYHRLSVVNIEIPPLRDRREDIPLLASRFLEEAASRFNRPVKGITPEARALLASQSWTGNVRQLKNAIESAVVLADGEQLVPDDFSTFEPKESPPAGELEAIAGPVDTSLPFMEAKRRLVLEFERRYIAAKLADCQGNISRAARELGMHRQSLQQKLKALGIKEPAE